MSGVTRRFALVGAAVLAQACAACGTSGPTRTYTQPSTSMLPTLKVGQTVTVSLEPHYVPKVGDIVAFHPPSGAEQASPVCGDSSQGVGHAEACSVPSRTESRQILIKRIVAGPADVVKIVNGNVHRNGTPESDSGHTEPCGGGPLCNFPAPITIPAGHYFVLGDNRGASDDSRFWGPVPKAWIIGKVVQP